MTKEFISEPIVPVFGANDAQESRGVLGVAGGEPGLPSAFEWRSEHLSVKDVRKVWRSTKEDRGDTYLARHWYEIEIEDGRVLTIYFDRHAKPGQPRWWLYTVATSTPAR